MLYGLCNKYCQCLLQGYIYIIKWKLSIYMNVFILYSMNSWALECMPYNAQLEIHVLSLVSKKKYLELYNKKQVISVSFLAWCELYGVNCLNVEQS